jgi:WD40 repeat protein
MRSFRYIFIGLIALAGWMASFVSAEIKVEQQPLGPDGDSIGCSISPHGGHVAVLAAKGSRFVILLDGVEGPKIEALQQAIYGNSFQGGAYWAGQIPVLFSNDGAHNAYIAKMGDEYVVFLDGKELARGPLVSNGSASINLPLSFSPGGKHLFYMDSSGGKFHVVVDGKPGPPTGFPMPLIISDDGEHYAYTGFVNNNIGNGIPNWAVVDGRQVNYIGNELQYTGKNVIVSRMSADGAQILAFNGKPAIKAAGLNPMWISPDGAQFAVLITPKSGEPTILSVNGKEVPDARGLNVEKVFFSPDGKRYAARCTTKTGSNFMIIDGKKGEVYQSIPQSNPSSVNHNHWVFNTGVETTNLAMNSLQPPVPGFTADSSKFVYVATQGGRQFLMVEDQESNGLTELQPTLGQTGHRIAAIGIASNRKQHLIIDDKEQEIGSTASASGPVRVQCLTFSPDGTRCAYVSDTHLVVDGVALAGITTDDQFTFSPDSKHVAYMASDGNANRLYVDGKIVDNTISAGSTHRALFSADSQHVISVKMFNLQSMGTKDSNLVCIDGTPAAHYSDPGAGVAVNFEFTPDGIMTFVARTDGNLRRFRVTLPTDTNVGALPATGTAPKDK